MSPACTDADSTECAPDTPTKLIYKLRDLLGVDDLGGTMRLGSYPCELTPGSLAAARLRQRVSCTSGIATATSSTVSTSGRSPRKGSASPGRSPDGKFVEIAELPGHPWYVAVQFHPEFKSKPTRPHPAVRGVRRCRLQAQDGTPGPADRTASETVA